MRSSRHNQRWPRPRDGPSHRLAITVPCCAHFREGPVLAILAMLALKDALCVAPGGSAPLFPFRSAPWPPMFQAGTGKRRLNRTRKPARHDRSHALTTQKGTSWRCGNRGHFGVALTSRPRCSRRNRAARLWAGLKKGVRQRNPDTKIPIQVPACAASIASTSSVGRDAASAALAATMRFGTASGLFVGMVPRTAPIEFSCHTRARARMAVKTRRSPAHGAGKPVRIARAIDDIETGIRGAAVCFAAVSVWR